MNNPVILREDTNSLKDLVKLKREYKIWKIIDVYDNQLKELFEINNPKLINNPEKLDYEFDKLRNSTYNKSGKLFGNWIYYPWNGHLLHVVGETDIFRLRTNRNKNLITKSEQKKLYDSCIGIIGLSVGSGIATGLAYQGIAKNLRLAEFDTLETTNLNRVRATLSDIGSAKIDIVAKQIYDINPYAKLTLFNKGLNKSDIVKFLTINPKPRIIFEIVDDFEIKVRVRIEAKKFGIPVIGPANLGDRVLIDIERYDLDRNLTLFNGRLGNLPEKILEKPDEDKNIYAVKMVEPKNIPIRAMDSVKEIGRTLVGRPQLSSTVSTSGSICTYLARRILLGDKALVSGRYLIDFDKLF